MGVNNVSFDEAMASKAAAGQYLRSAQVSSEEKGQLSAKWGADFVNQALSVDSTKYEISDNDKSEAHSNGYDKAKESTDGYERDKTGNWARAGASMAAAVGSIICTIWAATHKAMTAGTRALMWVAAGLNLATVLQYFAAKPNKEATNAADTLRTSELPQAQEALNEAQENMSDASEEITELTEEAEQTNEDANDTIEEKKTLFDFYRQQYDALKAKKEAGETLTPDEKAFMKSNAPKMEKASNEINTISEETSDTVNGINDDLAEYQDIFDESAETTEEVSGVTDYAESFDEDTKDNAGLMKYAMYANAAADAILAAKLIALPGLISKTGDYIAAGVAGVAGGLSYKAAAEQGEYQDRVAAEIDARISTQELNEQTNEIYEEELDNYAGNIETVEDLELEIPEDLEAPTTVAQDTADTQTPATRAEDTNKKDDNNNKDDEKKQDDKKNIF